ncbi:MAG: chemotaxis protein CheB [Thiohalocapsa sp.]
MGAGSGKFRRDIVVAGGSAGALDAFLALAAALPADFPASLLIVSHVGANRSQLPELLSRAGKLPATHARHGEAIEPGHIYIAPPDQHLLVDAGRVVLNRGPRVHFTRPAIDPLFRSAARSYGARVIGVVLSGTGSDGVIGLEAIHAAAGLTLAQAPTDALFTEMPQTAVATVPIDHVVVKAELAPLLVRLVAEPLAAPARKTEASNEMTELERPAGLTCPECGGTLREIDGTALKTYRCHTGHMFAADELLGQQLDEVERAVFVAVRVLNEHAELCRRMIEDAHKAGRSHGIAYWTRLKDEAEAQLQPLQRFLLRERLSADDENAESPVTVPVAK